MIEYLLQKAYTLPLNACIYEDDDTQASTTRTTHGDICLAIARMWSQDGNAMQTSAAKDDQLEKRY